MDTPICDFVKRYTEANPLRLHMPGHKGSAFLGAEQLDITEIEGADNLYKASGIIRKSEENASALFGCPTFYSTEGSSQCIRAMLYLAMLHAKRQGKKPIIAAARNVHKTFLSAVALLDVEVQWLYSKHIASYLSCSLTPAELEHFLIYSSEKPTAVYLTSPDYLGTIADIRSLSHICRKYGVLLLVDNAHGAYLRFLPESLFPMDLGADICCSSAHKTLPVLTGGAYLHLSSEIKSQFSGQIKSALALFGSTSPSYLILQSLDMANLYMANHGERLNSFVRQVENLKKHLSEYGYLLYGQEPIKITVLAKARGYTGTELAELLMARNIICEFADRDYLVLMLTPEIGEDGLQRLETALRDIPQKSIISETPPELPKPIRVLSIRDATFSATETVPVCQCEGRILATATVACPPAVPILVCGERIDKQAVACFHYYGLKTCTVVAET